MLLLWMTNLLLSVCRKVQVWKWCSFLPAFVWYDGFSKVIRHKYSKRSPFWNVLWDFSHKRPRPIWHSKPAVLSSLKLIQANGFHKFHLVRYPWVRGCRSLRSFIQQPDSGSKNCNIWMNWLMFEIYNWPDTRSCFFITLVKQILTDEDKVR